MEYNFTIHWYNQDEIVYTEPNPIVASNQTEAISKAYMLYGGKNTPGPLVYAEVIV